MKGLSAEELQKLLLSVGTHRRTRSISPVESGRLIAKALAAGMSRQEVAEALHVRDTGLIGEFVTLTRLDPSLQAVVSWGKSPSTIAFSTARELSRLHDDEQAEATRLALGYGLSSEEIKQIVQRRLRSKRPLQECAEEIIKLRPSVIRRHVLIGAIGSQPLRDLLGRMPQTERDTLLLRQLERLIAPHPARVTAARLSPERFIVVGDEELASRMTANTDFEGSMNRLLQQALEQR